MKPIQPVEPDWKLKHLLTVKEVATLLGTNTTKVRALGVPFYQVGSQRRYLRRDLEQAGVIKPMPQLPPPEAWVYFVGHGHKVKIGTAVNPQKRLAELQCGSPVPLKLLGMIPGGRRTEEELHRRWARNRLHSEWFVLCGELRSFIKQACA